MSTLTAEDIAAAEAVNEAFLDACRRRDQAAAAARITPESAEGFDLGSMPGGTLDFTCEPSSVEDDTVIIPVQYIAVDDPENSMPCPVQHTMVRHDGVWKLDLEGSMERTFGGTADALLEQMGDAIGDAFEQIGDALGEAMGAAFGSSSADTSPDEDNFDDDFEEEEAYRPDLPADWADHRIAHNQLYASQVQEYLAGLGINAAFLIEFDAFYVPEREQESGSVETNIADQGIYAFGSAIGSLVQNDPAMKERLQSLRTMRLMHADGPGEVGLSIVGSTIEYRFAPHIWFSHEPCDTPEITAEMDAALEQRGFSRDQPPWYDAETFQHFLAEMVMHLEPAGSEE